MLNPEKKPQIHHALVITTTQAGHINPMFEFSRRLAAHNFIVSFIVNEQHHARLQKKVEDDRIRLVMFPTTILHTNENEPLHLEERIRNLSPLVTCMISNNFLPWSQDLANRLGIPRAGFGTTNALTEVVMLNIPLLRSEGFLPVKANLDDNRLITFVPGLPHIHKTQLPFAFYEEEPHTSTLGRAYLRVSEAICLLEHTVEELELEPVNAWKAAGFKYLPVGPLIPAVFKDQHATLQLSEAESSCLKWLDEQKPSSVLYIAFGSQVSLPMELVDTIARGVLASKQRFLWAMRQNFVSSSDPQLYNNLKRELSKAGLVLEWAPQSLILEHSSVGGFFTHCGWGSTMEAICSGMATLCWPCDVDQNFNSYTMVEKWKTGMKVGEGMNGNANEEDIKETICKFMQTESGDQLRKRAKELRDVAQAAWTNGGSSLRNFQEFVGLIQAASLN